MVTTARPCSLLQHADEDFHSLLREWLNATLKNNTLAQSKFIEEIARLGREKQKQFLRHFTHLLEQAVRMEVAGPEATLLLEQAMSEGELDFARRLNRAMDLAQKEAVAQELDRSTYYIERNAHAKILFHALSIKIYHIVKNQVRISFS
jgi:DNA polymerase-3 subunit delta'